jgi:hypothetical protein
LRRHSRQGLNIATQNDRAVYARIFTAANKDHRTGEIVGNCNGCNTPQMLSTIKVLCPLFYDQLFSGYDPY